MSAIVLFTSQIFCQTRVLRGELTAFNSYPVANVKVSSKKAKATVTTDSLGKFQIVCNEKDILIVKSEVFTTLNLLQVASSLPQSLAIGKRIKANNPPV